MLGEAWGVPTEPSPGPLGVETRGRWPQVRSGPPWTLSNTRILGPLSTWAQPLAPQAHLPICPSCAGLSAGPGEGLRGL